MSNEQAAAGMVDPQAALEVLEYLNGLRRAILNGCPPHDAAQYLADEVKRNRAWLESNPDTPGFDRGKLQHQAEVVERVQQRFVAEPGLHEGLDLEEAALRERMRGLDLSSDHKEGDHVWLRTDSDHPGGLAVVAQADQPVRFTRTVPIPRIAGRNWVSRAVLGRGGWPYLMGKDPASGGTLLATFSFCRFIPSDMVEFYGVVMPENSESKLLEMLGRGKVPGMKMLDDLAKPCEIAARYRDLIVRQLGPVGEQVSTCRYTPDLDRIEVSTPLAHLPGADLDRLAKCQEKAKALTHPPAGTSRIHFGRTVPSLVGPAKLDVPPASSYAGLTQPPLVYDGGANDQMEATMVRYCPFLPQSRNRLVHEFGGFLEEMGRVRQELVAQLPPTPTPVPAELAPVKPEDLQPRRPRGRPKLKREPSDEALPGFDV